MAVTAGTRLRPYEIVAPLGSGGMGEVYRARETRLNRDVALKVLPDAFVLDPDRLARFKREAQVLARSIIRTLPPSMASKIRTGCRRWSWSWSRVRRSPIALPRVRCRSTRRSRSRSRLPRPSKPRTSSASFIAISSRLSVDERAFDVLPDGRFVGLVFTGDDPNSSASARPAYLGPGLDAAQIRVVLNWFEELKQRVPAR